MQEAFLWITSILSEHQIPYRITGGLAAQAYGSKRQLYDIDIDMDENHFQKILPFIKQYITFGPKRHRGTQWDLELITLNYHGQVIDLGGIHHTKIFQTFPSQPERSEWVDLPCDLAKFKIHDFFGIKTPVIPKVELNLYKAILARDVDLEDIKQMNTNALESRRLLLEPITEAHAEELHHLLSDISLHRFTPYDPLSLARQTNECVRWAKRVSETGDEIWLNWAARDRTTRKIIAHFQAGIKKDEVASIGYVVAREFQNQGLATEGLKVVFEHLKNDYDVKEIKAWTDMRNLASHQVAEKMGMKKIETIFNADFFKGAQSDEFVYSICFTPQHF